VIREVDSLILINYGRYDEHFVRELASLRDEMAKPIMVIPGHPVESREGMQLLTRNGIPSFTIPERALKALAGLLGYVSYRRESSP